MRNNLKSAFKMEFSDLNHQNIPKFQLAWLAATIECEGSITFGCNIRGKNRDMLCISPFISVTNSDQLLLKEVKRLLDILSERSFGSKPRFSKQYDHGARPGFRNTHGYKTNKNCQNIAETTGQKNLCLAGGVALNCVVNGILLRENIFEKFGSNRQQVMREAIERLAAKPLSANTTEVVDLLRP